jgi:glycosyltransferase involved in cell wall biosynthesis
LTTPLKPLEAMAMGKAIAVSDVGGLRELVHTQATGLMFPHSNPEALADTLIALGTDAALRARLGANARTLAMEDYDWARVVAVYRSIYRRLLSTDSTNATEAPLAGESA